MLKSLEQSLRRHGLVRSGERVGVAVSGGADSVALLRAFAELAPDLGVVLFVLHLNHKLRGPESEADQRFVAELAAQLSLDLIADDCAVAALAAGEHLSLEAAGRRARYEFFQRAAIAHRLDCVATAHTLDDQAETVLLRLLRGAGTSGLAGIHRVCNLSALCARYPSQETSEEGTFGQESAGEATFGEESFGKPSAAPPTGISGHRAEQPQPRLIRPFLDISRTEIEQYLLVLGQTFRQDASNLSPRFLRNRVRAELLPALERDYNPRLRSALCETAEVAAAENAFLEKLVSGALGSSPSEADARETGIDVPVLRAQPVALQRRILRRLCRQHGLALDFTHLERLRAFALAGSAGSLQLPRGFTAEIVRPKLLPPRLRLLTP